MHDVQAYLKGRVLAISGAGMKVAIRTRTCSGLGDSAENTFYF